MPSSWSRVQFEGEGARAHALGYGDSGPGYNSPSSSHISTYLDDQFKAL